MQTHFFIPRSNEPTTVERILRGQKDVKHMHGTDDVAGLCGTGLLRRGTKSLRSNPESSELSTAVLSERR